MLDDKLLQEYNRFMIGLGVPIERDDVGYNKPDYIRMLFLAHFTGELNDEMRYCIVSTLNRYKNTQLTDIKEEIEESLEVLKDSINDKYYDAYWTTKHNKSEFIPNEIQFIAYNSSDFTVNIHFDEYLDIYDITRKYNRDKFHWNSGNLEIHVTILADVIEMMREKGNFGLVPDAQLQDFIDNELEKHIAEYEELEKMPKALTIVSRNKNTVTIHYDNYLPEMKDLQRQVGYKNLRFVNDLGVWNTVVNNDCIGNVIELLDSLNYETTELKGLFDKINAEPDSTKTGLKLVDYNNYQLPFTPYPFQIEDAERIIENKRMLLGQDMGCGKTFIASLVGTSIDVPKLVICPASLRLNWRKEIKNITPDADIKVLYSDEPFEMGNDWTIIGYNTVDKYKAELLAQNIKCIFIDEAHYCKAVSNNGKPSSKRASAVLELTDNAEYVYPMTGTPMPTRNKDLYNIFRMLDTPEIIKGEKWDFFHYGTDYCDGYNNGYGWDFSGSSNTKELSEILNANMVRRLKSDVLPNLVKQRIFIPIETKSKQYFAVQQKLGNENDSETFMGLAMTGRRLLSKDKVVASIDLANTILESDNSVVIVSEFTETIDKIEKTYGDKCCVIRGGMTDKAKQQAIDDFQSGKKKVCALNMMAGGVGITLTKAHDMIICDYDWTPSNMSQVEDRICRAGQKEYCNIHYIYCENTLLDKTFMEMITDKSSNIDSIVDRSENTMNFKDNGDNRGYIKRLKDKVAQENKEPKTKAKKPKTEPKHEKSQTKKVGRSK